MPKRVVGKKSKNVKTESVSGFDIIGSAAILKLQKNTTSAQANRIAVEVMKKNKHLDRVFKKIGKISGTERIPRLVWIRGKKSSLVTHRENGCLFQVDIKKVFFTPRLSSERLRIFKIVKPNENVLDMFCGVGPYSILIAKKVKSVYAIDINPRASELLKINMALNKSKNVIPLNGDARKITKKLKLKFDRIIMNFPLSAQDFLDSALSVASDLCVIHLYSFLDTREGYESALDNKKATILASINKGFRVDGIRAMPAGETAPYVIRECFDISLSKIKR